MRTLGKIKKYFWHNRVFHSRTHKLKYWMRVLHRASSVLSIVFLVSVTWIYIGAFDFPVLMQTAHDSDDRTVEISSSDIEEISSRYDEDLEKGFCLYGYADREKIVVEEVVHDDNPLSQSDGRISFVCGDESLDRAEELLTTNLTLVGNVHTHPRGARLSRGDAFAFGSSMFLQDTYGVYNGEDLEFFSPGSLSDGLSKNVVS